MGKKSGVTIRSDTACDVLKRIQSLKDIDVLIGIPEGKARADSDGLSNAQLGYLQATGATIKIPAHDITINRSINADGSLRRGGRFVKASKANFSTTHHIGEQIVTLPPRPFLEPGIEKSEKETIPLMRSAVDLALDGNTSGAIAELNRAGQLAADAARNIIGEGTELDPLAPSTRRQRIAKGQDIKPLYVTGSLMRSITHVVRYKKVGMA